MVLFWGFQFCKNNVLSKIHVWRSSRLLVAGWISELGYLINEENVPEQGRWNHLAWIWAIEAHIWLHNLTGLIVAFEFNQVLASIAILASDALGLPTQSLPTERQLCTEYDLCRVKLHVTVELKHQIQANSSCLWATMNSTLQCEINYVVFKNPYLQFYFKLITSFTTNEPSYSATDNWLTFIIPNGQIIRASHIGVFTEYYH